MIISETIAELVTALAKAQGQIENASKSSLNPHFKSAYADLASVREAIREPLAANGLSIVQGVSAEQGFVHVETILFHASGQSISSTLSMPAGRGTPQDIGSASTYARRYGIMGILNLAGEDDDGNLASTNGRQGAPVPTGPIPPDQVEILRSTIVEVAADLPRFLKVFGIQKLEDMPAARYQEAIHMLDLKRKQTLDVDSLRADSFRTRDIDEGTQ